MVLFLSQSTYFMYLMTEMSFIWREAGLRYRAFSKPSMVEYYYRLASNLYIIICNYKLSKAIWI